MAALLAQLLLRPIHVIRSGLTRLGKGEFGVTLDLPPGDEFGELGAFFNTVSQQLSADRSQLGTQDSNLQSAVERAMAYSRKLVALGRLTAGIAHEVKNPLNAMMIHLELLRTKIRNGALAVDRAASRWWRRARSSGWPKRSVSPVRRPRCRACSRTSRLSRAKSAGSTRWCRGS